MQRKANVACLFWSKESAVRVERHLALRIGTKEIALLAVLLKRGGNERPRSYEVFGHRLRDYLLGEKNSANQWRPGTS